VAVCVNALKGSRLSDKDILQRHGYALLNALNHECASAGYSWVDLGELDAKDWPVLEKIVCSEGLPVVVALNGSTFCSNAVSGQIFVIADIRGVQVDLCNPATGKLLATTNSAMHSAPAPPDGNFLCAAVAAP